MNNNKKKNIIVITLMLVLAVILTVAGSIFLNKTPQENDNLGVRVEESTVQTTIVSNDYLTNKFKELQSINPDTIGYVYAPGTQLDEPIVQTTDNSTYLDKTFDGSYEPLMGTVFMDMDNNKNFTDQLTWLFGHARGSKVSDNRMFNDVNFYTDPTYFTDHPYVVIETPTTTLYYEVVALIIVPETTAFYKTTFESDIEFVSQMEQIYSEAVIRKPDVTMRPSDRYVVLSTCREEDPTIRSNLYIRQVPAERVEDFVSKNQEVLKYKPTREG